MATYRAQIAFTADTALPRDQLVITPHYTASDAQALADGLKTNLKAMAQLSFNPSFVINIYDATGPPPHHPLATSVNSGITPTSTLPREVAVCLSYYATLNQPQRRGRLYLPASILGMTAQPLVSAANVTQALAWGAALFKGLPTGAVAIVWSRKTQTARAITNYWVDNEWDTVRSRGLKSTTRQLATVP